MKAILLLFSFMCFLATVNAQVPVDINSGNPRFPFPQFLPYEYSNGHSLGNLGTKNAPGLSHAEMEQQIREAYQIMANRFVYTGVEVGGVKYIKGNIGCPYDCSEGDGYALLAAAIMADKTTFDGLWMRTHDLRLVLHTNYEDCSIIRDGYEYGENALAEPGGNTATDGDVDIVLALYIAWRQWGDYMGVNDNCGNPISYKSDLIDVVKGMVEITDRFNAPGDCRRTSGNIGFDGYVKNGDTWGETTNWASNQDPCPEYKGPQDLHVDYVAPAYFKEFYDLLESEGITGWDMDQYKRGEASSDWLVGEWIYKAPENVPIGGWAEVTPSGPEWKTFMPGEDFRASWRTIMNYMWHGNPKYTWNPETHQVDDVPNTYEYDAAVRMATFTRSPQKAPWFNECFNFGGGPEITYQGNPTFSTYDMKGDTTTPFPLNWQVGCSAPAAVSVQDYDLMGDVYRRCAIEWDVTAAGDGYLTSVPVYFHGWFRLFGMLVTTGNHIAPEQMEVIKANMKLYRTASKTFGFTDDIITYTFDYRNYASIDAEDVKIVENVPADFIFSTASNGGVYDPATHTVTWDLGTVPGLQDKDVDATRGKLTYKCRVGSNASGQYCASASISCSNGYGAQTNMYPNTVSTVMEQNCIDIVARALHVTKSVDRNVVNAGNDVTFTVDFENSAEAGWINGGRPGVNISVARDKMVEDPTASNGNSIKVRLFHGANEPYINYKNYRISYFLFDPSISCYHNAAGCGVGWKLSNHIYEGGDTAGVKISHENIVEGSDDRGRWNQRLIIQFADLMVTTTPHLSNYYGMGNRIHLGGTEPLRAKWAINTSNWSNTDWTDDWSWDPDGDDTDAGNYYPVTDDWTDINNPGIPVTTWHPDACETATKTINNVLVEEWDGYVWRRILGSGPVPGRDINDVVVRDTLQAGLTFGEFVGNCPLTDFGASWTTEKTADGRDIVIWSIPKLQIKQKGSIKFTATVDFPSGATCETDDELIINSAWIEGKNESPTLDTVHVRVTCAKVPEYIPPTTMVKSADKKSYSAGDDITYTLIYTQTHGSISEPDLTTSADWTGNSWNISGGSISSKGGNTDVMTYDYAYGTNGFLSATVDPASYATFRVVLREGAVTPIHLAIKSQGTGQMEVTYFEGTNKIEKLPLTYGGVAPIEIKVDLYEGLLRLWVNKDTTSSPIYSRENVPVGIGYAGFANGDVDKQDAHGSHSLSNLHFHFDAGFNISIIDDIPDETSLTTINDGGTETAGTITWNILSDKSNPVLFGEEVTVSWEGTVDVCNENIENIAYTLIMGHDEKAIGAQVVSPCSEGCNLPASVTVSPATDTEICDTETVEFSATPSDAGTYDYILLKDDVEVPSVSMPFELSESGTYVIRVLDPSDSDCYIDSDPIVLTVNETPSVVVVNLDSFCADVVQSVTVSPSGGTFEYVLTGETTATEITDPLDFTISESGNYTFTYTAEENGCSNFAEVEIKVFSVPIVSISPDPAAACSGVDLPLTATAEEGDGTYTFDWTHNGVLSASDVENPIFNSTDEKVHTISCVVEDGNGCSSEKELEVEVTGRPVVSLDPDPTVCKGETVLDLKLSHGLAGDSELKSPTAIFTDDGELDVVNTDVGIHTIEYIFSLSPGCSGDATVDIEVVDAPSITITGPTQLCEGAGTEVYTASPDDGAFIDIAGVFTGGTFDPATAGDYTVEYEATAANADCKAKGTLDITVHTLPEITIDLDDKYCPGEEVVLSATPAGGKFHGSAVVDGKLITDLINAGDISEVIYTVEESTTPFSCANSASAETQVVVLDPLTASNVTASIPKSEFPPLEATGVVAGAEVFWIPVLADGTFDNSAEASGNPYDPALTTEGVYTFAVVQRLDGCESEAVTVIYTVTSCTAEVPVVANPDEEICEGGTVVPFTSDATNAYWFAEGTVPATYADYVTDSEVAKTADFSPLDTDGGTYIYYVANLDETNNCFSGTAKATLTINKLPEPVIDGLEKQYCHNDGAQTLSLVPAGGTLTVNSSEYTGNDFDPGIDLNVGDNTFEYIYTDDEGCVASSGESTVTVVKVDQPIIDAEHTWLLEEAPTNSLDASGTAPEWQDSDSKYLSDNPYTPGYDAVGEYVSYVVDVDGACKSDPFEVTVKVIDCGTPVPAVENVTACAGASPLELSATGLALKWYDSDKKFLEEAPTLSHDNMDEGDYVYYVTQTADSDGNGACESKKAALEVSITPQPIAELPADYLEFICEIDGMVTLERNHETGETSEWENIDGYIEQTSLAYNFMPPSERVETEIIYRETAIDGGCSDEVVITVNSIFVPQPIVDETGTACPGSTDLVIDVTNAETGVDYLWTLNSESNAGTGETFEPERGDYNNGDNDYIVIGTDVQSGCQSEVEDGTFSVQKIEKPVVLVEDDELCFGETTEFETFIPGSGFLIRYYTDADLTQLEYEGTDAKYVPKAVEARVHTYYAVFAENCTSEPTEITFEILPEVEVPTVQDSETCEGTDGELVAEATGTIKWYDEDDALLTSSGGKLTISSATETAVYTAVNENSGGCESVGAEATLTVKAKPQPPVAVSDSGKDSKCDTELAPVYTATGDAGASFHWEMPGETVDAPTMTPVGNGSVPISVTQTVDGCESEPYEFTFIFYEEIPAPSNIEYTPCEGQLIDIDFDNIPSGAQAVWRKTPTSPWTVADNQAIADGEEKYETAFMVSESDGDCYSEVASLSISAISPPATPVAISDNPISVCYGNPEIMEVEPVDGVTMLWESESGMILEDELPTYTPLTAELSAGNATTFYVYAVEGECQSTQPLEFVQTMQEALAPPFASPVDVCAGSSNTVRLSALAFDGEVHWYENGEHKATGSEFLAPVPSVIFDETVTYQIRAVEDGCESPSAEAVLNVFVNKDIAVLLDENEVCTGTAITASTSSGENYTWSIDGEVVEESAESIVYKFGESGRKTITASSISHACLPSGEEYVYVAAKPELDFEAWQVNDDGLMNFKNKSLQEEIEWVGGFVSPEVIYEWDFSSDAYPSEGTDEGTPFSTHEVQYDYGLYKIMLSSSTVDYKGCESSIEKEIFVKLSTGLWVPNALTNDPEQREGVREFRVFGHNIEKIEITIYDNFNNIVWYSTALENGRPSEVWTGISIDGTMLKPDIYRWKIDATFKDGKKWKGIKLSNGEYINMGNIILLR